MQRRIVVWGEAGQAELIDRVRTSAGFELVGVGATRPDAAITLADALGVDRVDDVRAAIQHGDVDVLWLASRDQLEEDERRLVRDVGLPTVTSVPRPGSIADVRNDPADAQTARFIPMARQAPGIRALLDARETFGEWTSVVVAMRGRQAAGSLFSRLFDAMDLVLRMGGEVQSVDAALRGPLPEVPERLADLRGDMTAHVRVTDGPCIVVAATDSAGSWSRGVTVVGPGGTLRATDTRFEWLNDAGAVVEESDSGDGDVADLIAAAIEHRLHESGAPPEAPLDVTRVLALCEAARVSCRTGQCESPARLEDALGRL